MSKNYQKHRKNTAERLFWQPKCEDTETHTAAYTTYAKRIHVKFVTHGLFPFFVFEVKIYCMQNTVFWNPLLNLLLVSIAFK